MLPVRDGHQNTQLAKAQAFGATRVVRHQGQVITVPLWMQAVFVLDLGSTVCSYGVVVGRMGIQHFWVVRRLTTAEESE